MADKTTNSRISRRKLLATGATSVTIATTMGLPSTSVSAHSANDQPSVASQQLLTENDPFKMRIMASSEMQALVHHYDSQIELSNTVHYKYTHTNIELVTIALKQLGHPDRAIWAYFNSQSSTVSVLQFEFIPTSKMQATYQVSHKIQVSGRATIYTPTGQIISSAVFNNDAVIAKTSLNTLSINASGCDYSSCYLQCFNYNWNQLPWWVQAACGGACGGCFVTAVSCLFCAGTRNRSTTRVRLCSKQGWKRSPWHHLDSTSTTVNGKTKQCHILCNPLYTAYGTFPAKDRMTLLRVLQGGADPVFQLNDLALELMAQLGVTEKWCGVLPTLLPQDQTYTENQLDDVLEAHLPKQGRICAIA